jgi:hypothetical protein
MGLKRCSEHLTSSFYKIKVAKRWFKRFHLVMKSQKKY